MRYVICINNGGYEVSLSLNKLYRQNVEVENLPEGFISIQDESGEDYIFEKSRFEPVSGLFF